MRFLILNTDYPEFLADLYSRTPGLAEASYSEQLQTRYETLFSVADFYSYNLRVIGHEAWDIYVNNETLQRAWAREHGVRLRRNLRPALRLRRGIVPWPYLLRDNTWLVEVVQAQLEHFRPDVVIVQDVHTIGDDITEAAKMRAKLVIAQLAATPPPTNRRWDLYDLGITSFPPTLERFKRLGLKAEIHRLGFEPRVLEKISLRDRSIPVSFVGSFHGVHSSRASWLEHVASRIRVDVWTSATWTLNDHQALRLAVRGQAWGRAMYEILAASRITLNHHGNVEPYANNLRLFEATGMGALLVTDWKPNLCEYFVIGEELVAYHTADECVELVRHYLTQSEEAFRIAAAGQARTLREHNWKLRMQELVAIVERYLD